MEKNNKHERLPIYVPVLIGYAAGALAVGLPHLFDDASPKMREAQIYNRQVQEQLDKRYPEMQELVLDDKKKFTFSISESGPTQLCEGKYEVTIDTATAVGDIVCRVSMPVATTTTTLR